MLTQQKNNVGYSDLLEKSMVVGVWDDHDSNWNNGDSRNPTKK